MSNDTLDLQQLLDLSEIQDISGATDIVPFEMPDIKETRSDPENRLKDVSEDYKIVRDNMHFQAQLLRLAALKAFRNANTSDAPKLMEVFATLMAQMTTTNKQLLDVQKQMAEIIDAPKPTITQPSITTTGDVYVSNGFMDELGSQGDALAKIQRSKEKEVIDAEYNTTE